MAYWVDSLCLSYTITVLNSIVFVLFPFYTVYIYTNNIK